MILFNVIERLLSARSGHSRSTKMAIVQSVRAAQKG